MSEPGYWASRWPGEDGGPHRPGTSDHGPRFSRDGVVVTSRDAFAATMVVLRDPGEAYLLCHTGGERAVAWVEQIDPVSLAPIRRSVDLAGGPAWPGGIAAHADGALHVVFGNHAHRLAPDLTVLASATLPRVRPYNSFVVLPDGHLVTKDFGGRLPGSTTTDADAPAEPTELLVLDPVTLTVVARAAAPEPSIARLSALGDAVYLVGTTTLHRFTWDGTSIARDDAFTPRYRTLPGQTYGWDAVLALGAAWFLDNGEGTEAFAGCFRGLGVSSAPLHLVRVGLDDGAVSLTQICGLPGGIVANPPIVDPDRRIAIGYDSGNGVLAAFDIDGDGSVRPRWTRDQDHACHPLLFTDTGELVTNDYDTARATDQIVVLDIETGTERLRVDSGSPLQSVLFPTAGPSDDLYLCSFTTVTRVAARR